MGVVHDELAVVKRIRYKNINALRGQIWFNWLDLFINSVSRLLKEKTAANQSKATHAALKLTEFLDYQLKLTHFIPITLTLLGCVARIWDWMGSVSISH